MYVCLDCLNGHFEDNNNMCTPCTAGMYQDLFEQTNCKVCEIGTYTNETAQIQCTKCPAGTFQVCNQSSCLFVCVCVCLVFVCLMV